MGFSNYRPVQTLAFLQRHWSGPEAPLRGAGCKSQLRSRLTSVSGPAWPCARWDTWALIQSHREKDIHQ